MGILMAAVMIFGLMPGLTQVAHAAETIKNVAVTGFVKPETSATAITIDALSVPADAPYSIKRISWESSDIVPAEGGFQFDDISGETVYRLIIKLEADSGYSFASISQFESYTLNGGTELLDKCEIDSDGFFRMYTKWYTPVAPETTTISSVSLTVTEPTAGAPVPSYIVDVNNAGVSAESGANYTVVESGWLQNDGAGGSEYTTDTEFQAGKTYLLFATLSPNEGYQFSEECTGKVNGAAADDYYRRTPDLIVYKEFTIPAAETTYPVWVGDTQVNSANKDNILGDIGTPTAVYDPETHTLTLNDPTIMGEPSSASGAKIYIYDSSVTYTIDGTATIDGDIVMGNGWTADLVIKGNITAKRVVNPDHSVTVDGNLTINSSSVFALRASSITIASGTVDVTGSDYGIEGGTVTISGGTVMAKASSSTGSAIHAYTALSIAATHEIVLPAGGVLSSDGKDVCKSDGTTIATEAKIVPKETITEYPVWVGGTQVTSANKDDILSDGGKAKFDPDTYTLTLNDPTVTGSHEDSIIYSYGIDLTVKGSATLNDTSVVWGIHSARDPGFGGVGGSLTIDGNITAVGKNIGIHADRGLTISGGKVTADGESCGLFARGGIEISGADVSVTSDSYGIYSEKGGILVISGTVNVTTSGSLGYPIYTAAGDMFFSGGKVTVTKGDCGIKAEGKITITDGEVTAATAYNYGIYAKSIEIQGGTVNANGIEAHDKDADENPIGSILISGGTVISNGSHEGMYSFGTITISGGTVTASSNSSDAVRAKGDITISSGTVTTSSANAGIFAGGKLTINNGITSVSATCKSGLTAVYGKTIELGDELMIKKPVGGEIGTGLGELASGQVIFESGGTTQAKDVLIVPKEVTTYTVTFDVNGHGTAPAAQTVDDGKTATKPANPNETGWTFGGWYKEAACTNAYDFSTPVTANITLYAKWTEESVTPGVITYTVVSGGDSTWTKDSTSTITITVKRSEADDTCFSHFTGVQIDGTALAASDYEAKAGSTVITLKAATLQKLSTGSHTVTVIFDDGKAETSVTVKAAASPADSKSPKTGDNNYLGLWIVLVIISAIWLGTAVLIRKKHHYISKH